ncbi:hypothetical protein PoB_001633900 [Plakobranchus ocellatus]|uniref:Uncharacterized protein n=1 Tax=Plakobranchus ocellatus TaxID=259542 RepID=A0AAV3Z3F7_9GAST|nr:hypothetical protein PoB_001633900 [Plakobranchus ocellatus]
MATATLERSSDIMTTGTTLWEDDCPLIGDGDCSPANGKEKKMFTNLNNTQKPLMQVAYSHCSSTFRWKDGRILEILLYSKLANVSTSTRVSTVLYWDDRKCNVRADDRSRESREEGGRQTVSVTPPLLLRTGIRWNRRQDGESPYRMRVKAMKREPSFDRNYTILYFTGGTSVEWTRVGGYGVDRSGCMERQPARLIPLGK